MDYEQKYKEALERAKCYHNSLLQEEITDCGLVNELERIFPELKESEDERIRKAIIAYIDHGQHNGISNKDMVAWLEKQGKQEPVDNVEPKFKAGDWIVDDKTPNDVFCVIEVLEEIYKVIDIDGDDYHIPHCKADKQFHLWTIDDAKDGDALVDEDNNIGLYLGEKDDSYWHSCIYLGCDNCLRAFSIGGYHKHKNTKPATKEQRELLFSKMKQEGHEWDAEKKELKKIEPKSSDEVEPKFKVGVWVVSDNNGEVWQIGARYTEEGQRIYLSNVNDEMMSIALDELNNDYHLWTIQDAKDGDVLVTSPEKGSESNEQIFLFKAINSRDYVDDCIEYYFRLCDGVFYKNTIGYMGTILDTFYPATKEQRDLLFQKMGEAEYEWDAEKKELKRIESKKLDSNEVIAWLVANIRDYEYFVEWFKKDFGL